MKHFLQNYLIGLIYIMSFWCQPSLLSYPRKLRSVTNPLFISLEELIVQARRYTALSSQSRFRYSGFPLERESVVTGKAPGDIEGVFPATFVLEVSQARVFGKNGYIVIEKEGQRQFFRETLWDWEDIQGAVFKTDFSEVPVRKIEGRVAVIAQAGSNNYYHWMTEILPRLALLNRGEFDYDYLYVPPLKHDFQKESLVALGINMDCIIEGDDAVLIEPSVLIIPSAPSYSTVSPYWVVDFLRNAFLDQQAEPVNSGRHKRIFISRKKAAYRTISNESELIVMLQRVFDVHPVILEDYSIAQQAQLFAHADIIIAPHGAGLANLVFARIGTTVIEIFQYHLDETFWVLSQQMGLRHYCISALNKDEQERLKDSEFALNEGRYATTLLDSTHIEKEIARVMEMHTSVFSASQIEQF